MKPTTLILDAMGVIFEAGDDVGELLIPFIIERGGSGDTVLIGSLYREASLGRLSADQFWERVGLSPEVEDDYLARHRLMPGLVTYLERAGGQYSSVWCLSNDVEKWSLKLRQRFRLDRFFDGSVISGEVGLRKPDRGIYEMLLQRANVEALQAVFVDDRLDNLDAAGALGMKTVLFGSQKSKENSAHEKAQTFGELRELLQ